MLAEQWGCQVLGATPDQRAGHLVGVEAQRRSRQGHPPEGRVVDLEQQVLGARLLPRVHVVEGPHLPGRDARLGEGGEPVLGAVVGEGGLDLTDQIVAMCDALGVGANRASSPSSPATEANRRHNASLPTAIWTGASAVWNSPYGAMDG